MSELIYEWDLDYNGLEFHQDVTTDTPILEHIYISHGDKRVMLRVVDDNGAYDTTVVGFKIINVPPVSNITADEIINGRIILAGTATILFKGSESSDTASDRGNLHYEWSVNGRVLDQENSSFSYTFRDVGEYELSLKVVDDDGDVDVSKITVVVEPPPGIFSNAGMALYIPLAIVFLLIPLIVFIIIRKKRNREGSVDASVKTEPDSSLIVGMNEDKEKEYDNLYGNNQENTVDGLSTYPELYDVDEMDNPFIVNETPQYTEDSTISVYEGNEEYELTETNEQLEYNNLNLFTERESDISIGEDPDKSVNFSSKTKKLKEMRRKIKKRSFSRKKIDKKSNGKFDNLISLLDEVAMDREPPSLIDGEMEETAEEEGKDLALDWDEDESSHNELPIMDKRDI
jgi:hypothetical protein